MKFAYYGTFGEHNTESHIAEALEDLGHEVIRLDKDSHELPPCNYRLFAKLKDDFIISHSKEPTICWLFDLYRDFPGRGMNQPMFKADYVFTTDGGDKFDTIRQGIRKADKKMLIDNRDIDIMFVGEPYTPYRQRLVQKYMPRLVRNVRGFALNKLLAKSKIVLGDSYPADNYWSNRIYEITGRGGFLIHPETKGLPDYIPQYPRGKEYSTIRYYLENDEEREKLRQIQFHNCPTYHDRVKELLTKIKK